MESGAASQLPLTGKWPYAMHYWDGVGTGLGTAVLGSKEAEYKNNPDGDAMLTPIFLSGTIKKET